MSVHTFGGHRGPFGLAALTLAALAALDGHAQDAAPAPAAAASSPGAGKAAAAQPSIAIETVVVTAEKRSGTVQKTPLAVTAITGDGLKQMDIVDAKALSGLVPGVLIGEHGRDTSVSIRGVSSTNVAPSQDPSVAFNIDSVYISRPTGANSAFYDIERVEILRGPQGTLWGRNATGGAINVVTRKPVKVLEGSADLTLGNDKRVTFEGMLNVPVSDTLALRGSVLTNRHDGYARNHSGGPDSDDADEKAARLHVLWTPTSRLRVLLTADSYDRRGAGSNAIVTGDYNATTQTFTNLLATGAADPGVSIQGPLQRFVNRAEGLTSDITYSFDGVDFTSLSSYRKGNLDLLSDLVVVRGVDKLRLSEPGHSFSQELRLTSTAKDRLKWVAGLYYMTEKNRDDSYVGFAPSTGEPMGLVTLQPDVKARSSAVFGQGSYALTSAINLTAGLRYTRDDKASDGASQQFALFGFPPVPMDPTRYEGSKVTWRTGIDWSWSPANMVYANLATGYKSGGHSVFAAYQPELLRSIELGSKNRFLDDRLQLNLAAFDYDYRDLQLTTVVSNNGVIGGLTTNAARAKVRGLEAEMIARVTPAFRLNANASLLRARFGAYPQATDLITGSVIDVSGNTLPRAPRFTFNLGASYDFNTERGSLTARFDTRYSSTYYLTEFNDRPIVMGGNTLDIYGATATQRAFTQSRASLRYAPLDGSWYAEAFVDNIEDKQTLGAVLIANTIGMNAAYGPPRTFGVKAGISF